MGLFEESFEETDELHCASCGAELGDFNESCACLFGPRSRNTKRYTTGYGAMREMVRRKLERKKGLS
jgi:hypothetical protein